MHLFPLANPHVISAGSLPHCVIRLSATLQGNLHQKRAPPNESHRRGLSDCRYLAEKKKFWDIQVGPCVRLHVNDS